MISYPITLPTSPITSDLSLIQRSNVAVTRSPFSGQMQKQAWSAEWWEIKGVLPPMKAGTGGPEWEAALRQLRGMEGYFYFCDPAHKTPRGTPTGTPLVAGANQTGHILLIDGCATNVTGWLKAGDMIQLGGGLNGTRITTSGGTNTIKTTFPVLTPSVSGQVYVTSVNIKNIGSVAVSVKDLLGGTQSVAPGATVSVKLQSTGDGVSSYAFEFAAPTSGDNLDFIAWDPVCRKLGVEENLIPAANKYFVGWSNQSGATKTLTQGMFQRLHQVMEDVNTTSGGVAELNLWPALRESPLDNTAIVTSNPSGIFQLSSNMTQRDFSKDLAYGLQFAAQEVL